MQNYHKHTYDSNIFTPDSAATYEEYAKRAMELNHNIISTVEHGWQGSYHNAYEIAKKYGLKFVFGAEAYWVNNRFEADRSNKHIIILAKNENGRQAINDVLSEANISGYYYKPRLDIELLISLPSDDVVITTACVAFWNNTDDSLIEKLHKHFGSNFFLEIQYHNTEKQIELNKHILELSRRLNIEMIVGLDSHYIYPEDYMLREYILEAKNMHYDDEDGWYMDYPDDDTVMERFLEQGVFSKEQIQRAMDNTDICLTFDDYDNVPVFTKDIKLPKAFPDKTQEETNDYYGRLVTQKFLEYTKGMPKEEFDEYFKGVKMEVETYKETGMADYPLIDYRIVQRAIEKGGLITDSGRGCFTKDALVHTKNTLKTIDNIVVGDEVVDLNGEFKKVINTMKYDIEEELIQINYLYGSIAKHPNVCTKDHHILIYDKDKKITRWVEAQNLKQGDFVCVPKMKNTSTNTNNDILDLNKYNIFGFDFDDDYIYEYNPFKNNEYEYSPKSVASHIGVNKKMVQDLVNGIKDDFPRKKDKFKQLLNYIPFNTIDEYREYVREKRTTKIPRYVKKDFMYGQFIGLMYGDGCCRTRDISISLAINNTTAKNSINKKVFYRIAKRFGLEVYENKSKTKKLTQLYMRSKIVNKFVLDELFVSEKGKEKTFNESLYSENENVKKGILDGLLLSDGSIEHDRINFDNTSLSLINAFKLLCLQTNFGVGALTVRDAFERNGFNCRKSYKLRYRVGQYKKQKKSEVQIQNDDYWCLPIKEIIRLPKTKTTVYDFTVEGSHSYLLNNMIVHNSGVGYFTNTLCGFSKVDRFKSPIKLYPERFISKTRILETRSLPD